MGIFARVSLLFIDRPLPALFVSACTLLIGSLRFWDGDRFYDASESGSIDDSLTYEDEE